MDCASPGREPVRVAAVFVLNNGVEACDYVLRLAKESVDAGVCSTPSRLSLIFPLFMFWMACVIHAEGLDAGGTFGAAEVAVVHGGEWGGNETVLFRLMKETVRDRFERQG